MSLPRMRSAPGVLEIIKEQDPDTELTLSYIKRLIRSGKFPVVPIGRKRLVDADAVIAYLAKGDTVEAVVQHPAVSSGGIRKVEERLV